MGVIRKRNHASKLEMTELIEGLTTLRKNDNAVEKIEIERHRLPPFPPFTSIIGCYQRVHIDVDEKGKICSRKTLYSTPTILVPKREPSRASGLQGV